MYITFVDKDSEEIITRNTDIITPKNDLEIDKKIAYIEYLYEMALSILSKGDINSRYQTIYKRKKNGTKRRIDIPDEELKKYMKALVDIFTHKINFIFPKVIYAYVTGRSTKQMAQVHTGQYSIMKFDLENFFPNCNLEFILQSMSQIYPFALINSEIIETIVKVCMIYYDGKYRLPQGAPSSPILSNIAMIPINYAISCRIRKDAEFTIYADDLFVSHSKIINKETFHRTESIIKDSLAKFNPDLKLNSAKTKFLKTQYGNIRLVGLFVGKDISIGNKKKQIFKATIWSFLMDTKNNKIWSKERINQMLGFVSYCKYIEPKFVDETIKKYEQKTDMNYEETVKNYVKKGAS